MRGLSSLSGHAFWMSCENFCKFGTLWDFKWFPVTPAWERAGDQWQKLQKAYVLAKAAACLQLSMVLDAPSRASREGWAEVDWSHRGRWDWAVADAAGPRAMALSLARPPQKQGARDQERGNKARSSRAERPGEERQHIGSGGNGWMGPAPAGAEMDPRSSPPLHSSAVSKYLWKPLAKCTFFRHFPTLEWLDLQL